MPKSAGKLNYGGSDGRTDKRIDRQTNGLMDRLTGGLTDRQNDGQNNGLNDIMEWDWDIMEWDIRDCQCFYEKYHSDDDDSFLNLEHYGLINQWTDRLTDQLKYTA